MPIAISCSKCNRKYQVRDELAGKTAKCSCGQTIVIPTPPPVGLASFLDDEDIGVVAPVDPFAEIPEDVGSQTMPLQPVKAHRKKSSVRIKVSPTFIRVLMVGGVACVLIGGLVYFAIGLMASPPPRWNTPEEVFKAGSKAAGENDWGAYYETICPTDQDRLARHALLGAMTAADQMAVFKDICTKYGVTPVKIADLSQWRALEDQVKATVASMSASNKSSVFVDTAKILADEERLPMFVPRGISANIKFFNFAKGAKSCILVDMRIEGDRASAVREFHNEANNEVVTPQNRMQFVKISGEWRQVVWNAEDSPAKEE